MDNLLTPLKIVEALNKYIVGQDEAKKSVAIALRNRWRRLNAAPEIRREIVPNNILMIGPTGVGKTEIARRLAQLAQAPFVKVEASKFTEVGYVGRDVESMVRDLVEQSINLVTAEKKELVREKAINNANEAILDILIPPLGGSSPGSGFESNTNLTDQELNEKTREKFREKLKNGELDDKKIELDVRITQPQVQVMGPMGMDGMDGLQDMFNNMMPKKRKRRKMTVAEAREYLIEEEAEKLIDQDSVHREAIDRAQNSGIIFIDEIDKIASGGQGKSGPDVSREGVQRDLLPIIEGSTVSTKYGIVKTDHILFIAAGAFHIAKPSDLIPELQGRLPIRVELESLTEADFYKILKQPKNALTKQYEALLASENVELSFEDDALLEIAKMAFQLNQEVENIGARRLHTIMSRVLEQILFEVPDINESKQFLIKKELIQEKLAGVVKQKDASHYIL